MNDVFLGHPFVQTLAWSLLYFVWQGALLGLAAFIVLRVIQPVSASARYLVGVATLTAMLIVPVATFVSLVDQPKPFAPPMSTAAPTAPALVTGSIVADVAANPSATRTLLGAGASASASVRHTQPEAAWLPVVAGLWLAGVSLLSLRLLGGWILTRTLARRAVVRVSPTIEAAASEIARRLNLHRGVAILESAAVSVPTLVGWMRPVVLLPAAALVGLSPAQLQAILAHELAHVRRHDYLINLLQSMVETLLFYHPAVWWVSSQVRAEREHCCDDLAVAVCGDRLVYVSALAELTSMERQRFALAATDGSLLARVKHILGRPDARRELPPSWGFLVLLVALLGGGAGSYEMATAAADTEAPAAIAETQQPREQARLAAQGSEQLAAPFSEQQPKIVEVDEARQKALAESRRQELRDKVTAVQAALVQYHQAREELRAAQERDRGWFGFDPVLAQVAPAPPAPAAPPAPVTPVAPPSYPERMAAPVLAAPAPPAPPSPPAPMAPPPPPAQATTQTRGSSGNFIWSDDGERLSVKWTGAFGLSDDERDIAWVQDGALVTITDGVSNADRIELRGLPGNQVERTIYRNGTRREFDAEARAFLANVITRLIRSGMFAAERVARILKQGGADAVLAEIERLQTKSSYVHRVYYTALVKSGNLTTPQLTRVLERAGQQITSDHEKGLVLSQVLQLPTATDEHRVVAARAAGNINSDYEQRKVLTAVLSRPPVSETIAMAVLEAAESINSSHERSTLLIELGRAGGLTARTSDRYMRAVSTMSSSHDQRRVLASLSTSSLPRGTVVDAVKAASGISSSHDKSEVLLQMLRSGGLTADSAPTFFASAATITSSHDLSRVLRAVAAQPNLSDAIISGLLRASASVTSSHDRSLVLLDLLKTQTLSPSARQLFLDAAQGISSTVDQNRVLAELVRSERKGR
jgi:beta-lactamase regulating signal transducer with metallopeptidase domain